MRLVDPAPERSAPPLEFAMLPMTLEIVAGEARQLTWPFHDGIEGVTKETFGRFCNSVTSWEIVNDCPLESDMTSVTG